MTMLAGQFLDLLERRGVLQPIDIESLREQVAAAPGPLHPAFIARRLVQAGFLNAYFAKTLLMDGAKIYGGVGDDELTFRDEESPTEPIQIETENTLGLDVELESEKLGLIGSMDLLSLTEDDEVPLLPGARSRSALARVFHRGDTWKTVSVRQLRFQRIIVIVSAFLLGALLVAWLAYLAVASP